MKEITQAKIYYLKELQMSKFSDLEYASKNWLMTIPKDGYEENWRKARDTIQFIDDWINELEAEAEQQAPLSGYDFPEGGFHENK